MMVKAPLAVQPEAATQSAALVIGLGVHYPPHTRVDPAPWRTSRTAHGPGSSRSRCTGRASGPRAGSEAVPLSCRHVIPGLIKRKAVPSAATLDSNAAVVLPSLSWCSMFDAPFASAFAPKTDEAGL